jgi:hypothetical protein
MNIETLYLQAELALAAYANNLAPGEPPAIDELTSDDCGMSLVQA